MGSYDSAVMTGFICRLCSELNRNVVHIYSEKGRKLELSEKINLMPISVEPHDSLPKTICEACIAQLDSQYRLIQQLKRSREKIMEHQERIRNAERDRRALLCGLISVTHNEALRAMDEGRNSGSDVEDE